MVNNNYSKYDLLGGQQTKDLVELVLKKGIRRNIFTNRVENADGSLYEDLHLNSLLVWSFWSS